MNTKPLVSGDPEAVLNDWLKLVNHVIDEARTWAQEANWSTHTDNKAVHEELLGDYTVPNLRIKLPEGELYVEPIARYIVGAAGRIDLMAWPSLYRVKLIRKNDDWRIMTDSNVAVKQPWNRETFVGLARELVATS